MSRRADLQKAERITRQITTLNEILPELYQQRRGLPVEMIDGYRAYCVVCGENVVNPVEGEDTCRKCIAAI